MAILFELSDSIVKKAAFISSRLQDRSLSSIIEECFNYGADSLYLNSENLSNRGSYTPRRMVTEEYSRSSPPDREYLESLSEITESIAKQAKDNIASLDREAIYSDSYTDPIIGSNGMFEL